MIDLTSEFLQAGKCIFSVTHDTYCGKKAITFYEIHVTFYKKNAEPSSYVCFCKSCDEKCRKYMKVGETHVAVTQEEFTMKNKTSKAKKIETVSPEADSSPDSSPDSSETSVPSPSKDELEKLVWLKPMPAAAKEIGVSVLTLRKRCKKFDVKTPPVGYWSKKDRSDKSA
jgi:hypothetical protein